MVALNALPTLRLFARGIAFTAAAGAALALAQARSPSAIGDDRLQQIVERIEAIESLRGANSPELIAALTELSALYEDRGANDLALAVIERARQVVHLNFGLQSLDEVPLLKQWIRIAEAQGKAKDAWEEEQSMLALVRRHPNDMRTAETLEELADKRMAMLARYEAGEFPPQLKFGCYYREWTFDQKTKTWRRTGCNSGNRYTAVNAIRAQANAYGIEAANIGLRRARWINSVCEPPQTPVPGARQSRRDAKAQGAEHLSALSDFASCLEVKYEHAERTSASAEDLLRLRAEATAAARALEEQRASYEKRFGPIRAPVCPGDVFPPAVLRSLDQLACVND
jgi:hypothetical protein